MQKIDKDKLIELRIILEKTKDLADDLDLCWISNNAKHAISEINKIIKSIKSSNKK